MNTLASFLPFLIEITLKTTVLLGLACAAGLLMKGCSAALRHAMRVYALIAVLLLPALSYLMPAWHWQGLSRFLVNRAHAARAGEMPNALPAAAAPSRSNSESRIADLPPSEPSTSMPAVSKSQLALNWPQALLLIWLVGIVLIALRLVISRLRLALLVCRAARVDDAGWRAQAREIAALLSIRRSVALLQSHETEVPLTNGSWHPKIIFSPDYLEWSWLRREAILRHELAHIRRFDTLAQAICHLAITVYWFHPLVWIMAKAMREERERACDDYVLAAGTKPSDYARELLAIASGLRQPDFITALALARRSPLEGRVMALLNPAQSRGSISQSTVLIVALLTLCIVLPLAAIQTAAPQPESPKAQTGSAAKPSPSAPSAEGAKPAKPPKPRRGTAVPPSLPAPPAPAAGVAEGVAGGVPGGVPGGVSGGVPTVPALEAPPAPPAPAGPQAAPQAAPPPPPPPPASSKPQALPKPAPLPVPAVNPVPRVAPVAPNVETAPTGPQEEAAKVAALAAVQAKLVTIHAQQEARQAAIKALEAKIADKAGTGAVAMHSIESLRAERKALAAITASKNAEVAAVRAQIAALAATNASAASTIPEVLAVRSQIEAAASSERSASAGSTCASKIGHAGKITIKMERNSKSWTAISPTQNCRIDMRSEGNVTFNQSTGMIESISPDGHVEIDETNGDTKRSVSATSAANGPRFVFKVNGTDQAFDDEAKGWAASLFRIMQKTSSHKPSPKATQP